MAAVVHIAEHAELFALLERHLDFPGIFHGLSLGGPALKIRMVREGLNGGCILIEAQGLALARVDCHFKKLLLREASRIAGIGCDQLHLISSQRPQDIAFMIFLREMLSIPHASRIDIAAEVYALHGLRHIAA